MPAYKLKDGQSTPSVADFAALGPLTTVAAKGTSALRELIKLIREGAKKDPLEVLRSEGGVMGRVIRPTQIKTPKGFELPEGFQRGTTPRTAREASLADEGFTGSSGLSPANEARMAEQQRFYGQFKRPQDLSTAPSARGLEDALNTTVTPQASHTVKKPLLTAARGYRGGGPKKLDPDKVRKIRELVSQGVDDREIAEFFGVNFNTIRDIRLHNAWQKVK